MPRFVVLTAVVFLFPVLGCGGETGETDLPADTTETRTEEPADSVSQWVHAGEAAAVTNGEACLYVTTEALSHGLLGDSVQVSIAPIPAEPDTLPLAGDLAPAFQAAIAAGWTIFPPVYRFHAYDAAGQPFTEFSPVGESVVVVAMCVSFRPGEEEALQRARIARPDPANPESLQFFELEDPPAECQLMCEPLGSEQAAQEAALPLERWLTGSPLTATPAYAAQCVSSFMCGIGGGGSGNSPFAAVDSLTGEGAEQAP